MQNFGIETVSKFVELNPKDVVPPSLKFKDSKGSVRASEVVKTGSWNLIDRSFVAGAKCYRCLHTIYLSEELVNVPDPTELRGSLRSYGISVDGANVALVTANVRMPGGQKTGQYRPNCQAQLDQGYHTLVSKSQQAGLSLPTLVMVIIPTRSIPLYGEIKTWGDCVKGIPTVCITKKKLEKFGSDPNLCGKVWYVSIIYLE